jgi:hypothetical protein
MPDRTDRELLEELTRNYTEMSMNMAVLTSEFKGSCKTLTDICTDYYGKDGNPGTKGDVSTLKTKMAGLLWVGSLIGGAAITGAVAGLWALLKGKQ